MNRNWGPSREHPCISDLDQQQLTAAIRQYELSFGPLSRSGELAMGVGSLLYPFYPIGATSYRDIIHNAFVDLDPVSGGEAILDFNCGAFATIPPAITYGGHNGIDSSIRNGMETQLIGLPVFAVLDGVVIAAHDGEPDGNACDCSGLFPAFPPCPPDTAANFVSIDHGGGRTTNYFHLRNGSVSVAPGQTVRAGQQIGMVGSSGCSTGPHLHFGSRQDGEVYEPFAGDCRPGPSGWLEQEPLNLEMFVFNCAPSRTNPNLSSYPAITPRERQVLLSDPMVFFRVGIANLPANSFWQIQFIRPNGTVGFTSAVSPFNAQTPNPFRRVVGYFWGYPVLFNQQIPGTWHIRVFINGELQVEAPVDAVVAIDPDLNSPPVAVSAAMEPSAPSADNAIFCRVTAPLMLDDPDYDVVRYRYQWKVNGNVVRDTVSAGHADALAAGVACSGAQVGCEVTPYDGQVFGPTASAATVISGERSPDINCDGVVNVTDLLAVINSWGACPAPPQMCPADVAPPSAGDGMVNVSDLLMVINNWS